MKEILEELIKKAKAEGAEVHVVHLNDAEPEEKDAYEEVKQEAEHIAKVNRILYEAHINSGFKKNEALALTRTVIDNN